MLKFFVNFFRDKHGLKKFLIVSVSLFAIIWGLIYYNTYYVIVRFDELGPVSKNMLVYYNGFRIGKIVEIDPDKDFTHTLVRVNLSKRNLNLPRNTIVQLKNFPSGELYLQFVYPSCPSLKPIRRGEVLEGIAPYNLEQFMLGQNISGVTDLVSIHVIQALDATKIANMEMENFFTNTSFVVTDNRQAIKESFNNTALMTKNLAETAENLKLASRKLNRAIDADSIRVATRNVRDSTSNVKDSTQNLKASSQNIQDSTQNIKETTESINRATKNLDKTMQKVDETISQANSTAANLNCLTGGLNKTFSKRFGGMRVIFGRPIAPKH